ncbi:MAG: hypothetical protein LUG98_06660 [Tannerellaceae bacterium]|nr:hypothetical protein [Tannerellaceae bacterium]
MKKLVLLICLVCTTLLQAQEKADYKTVESVTFFGVDYSLVKLYGAREEPYQYKLLFREINNLFRTDPKTYNLPKFFAKKEVALKLDNTNEVNNIINPNDLKIFNKEYKVSDEQIKEHIRNFHTGDTSGYGIVMLATILDQSKSRGHYTIVIFDIESRDILRSKSIEAKATGNSFINYWASSVLNALKVANK